MTLIKNSIESIIIETDKETYKTLWARVCDKDLNDIKKPICVYRTQYNESKEPYYIYFTRSADGRFAAQSMETNKELMFYKMTNDPILTKSV